MSVTESAAVVGARSWAKLWGVWACAVRYLLYSASSAQLPYEGEENPTTELVSEPSG